MYFFFVRPNPRNGNLTQVGSRSSPGSWELLGIFKSLFVFCAPPENQTVASAPRKNPTIGGGEKKSQRRHGGMFKCQRSDSRQHLRRGREREGASERVGFKGTKSVAANAASDGRRWLFFCAERENPRGSKANGTKMFKIQLKRVSKKKKKIQI